jgi:flagellar hook-basal body complex protein FliE
MSPIGSVSPLQSSSLARIDAPLPKVSIPLSGPVAGAPAGPGFSSMLDGLVATVDSKQASAHSLTNRVLLGQSDQLHQSVIAMQEASVAFSLMVEVRNKLVESYQELMRMQV